MSTILARPEIAVMVGIIGAVVLVVIARLLAPRREMLVYGVGLGVTAIAYVLFAILRSAPGNYLGHELFGAAIYGTLAVLGTRGRPSLLALGWIAHVVWDLFFHYANGPGYAPVWYAMFCVGFDLVIGGFVAGLVAQFPAGRGPIGPQDLTAP